MLRTLKCQKFKHALAVVTFFTFSFVFADDDNLRETRTDSDGLYIQQGSRWSDTLFEFSVSGVKGDDGQDGVSFRGQQASDGSSGFAGGDGSNGRDGRDGGAGEEAAPGERAGEGFFRFGTTDSVVGLLTIDGYLRADDGNEIEFGKRKVYIDENGFIRLVARGGNGGMGGYGGWGEKGGDGGDGGNGIGNQRGGDGGNGGRGGDAGTAADGADGADGGHLKIQLPVDHLELAWVIDPLTPAGLGGEHGEHGRAGDGGSGGSGGMGGTYQEQETRTRTTTDSDGNTSTETYTVTVTKQAPNGFSGSSGSDGNEENSPLYRGDDGNTGTVEWEIIGDNGEVISTHRDRFRLQLAGFSFVDVNRGEKSDGIFEPGEKGYLKDIFVRNLGDMPTPANAKARVKVASGAYYVTDEIEFSLPEGLEPGEVRQVQTENGDPLEIEFNVKDYLFTGPTQEPFVRQEMIRPKGTADVAQVARVIPEFNQSPEGVKEFTVQFPVLIEPIDTPPSLARGEAGRFILKVTNVSGQDFGGESEIGRHLIQYFERIGGDLGATDVEFFNKAGEPLKIGDGFIQEILNLRRGQSKILEFVVGVSPAADSYRTTVNKVDLDIDRLGQNSGQQLQTIQSRLHTLSVADDYMKTPDSDFLLVTNHRMGRTAYESWKTLAHDYLQTDLDIWDLSYKNFISFMERLTDLNDVADPNDPYSEYRTSLAEDFKGKTIILLANDFGDTSGQNENNSRNVWDYAKLDDLRRAAVEHGINLRIVSQSSQRQTLKDLISPRELTPGVLEYSSLGDLKEAVENGEDISLAEAEGRPYYELGMRVPLTRRRFFTKPSENYLYKKAKQLFNYVMGEQSDVDNVVVHRFKGEVIKRHGVLWNIAWFGTSYHEGDLEVWRSPKAQMGHVVLSNLPLWEMNSEQYILSDQNVLETLMARSFERNVQQMESYITGYQGLSENQKKTLPLLTEAVMKQLVLEQVSLRARLAHVGWSRSQLYEHLKYLNHLESRNFQVPANAPEEVLKMVSDLLLNVQVYSLGQRKWWERFLLINQTKNAKVGTYTRRVARDLMDKWLGNNFDRRTIRRHIKDSLARKKSFLRGRNALIKREQGEAKTWADLTLDRMSVDQFLENDVRFTAIASGEEFDRQQERLDRRDSTVLTSSESAQRERGRMNVPNPMVEQAFDRIQGNAGVIMCRDVF